MAYKNSDTIDISKEIEAAMTEYVEEVGKTTEAVFADVANETAEKVAELSPVSHARGRHYAKGWKVKRIHYVGASVDDFIVYNATKPRLTHLLENGWTMRNGERHEGTPHISTAQKWAEAIVVRKLKEKL